MKKNYSFPIISTYTVEDNDVLTTSLILVGVGEEGKLDSIDVGSLL